LPTPQRSGVPAAGRSAFELTLALPFWERFKARFGRTTIGLSGLAPDAWPPFSTLFLVGELPAAPPHDTPALSLRFVTNDLKTLYGEAVQADGAHPSARKIDRWFWRRTVAGQLPIAPRAAAMESQNNPLQHDCFKLNQSCCSAFV
jgi:hypothetical protein